jgi:MFS family permease
MERRSSPWRLVFQAAAALAVSMGIGRFAYTPILPLMHAQAGLSAGQGSALAIANYVGYLVGAMLTIVIPGLASSGKALRAGLLALIASVALMALTESQAAWLTLRLAAGIASAVVFIIAASTMLTRLRQHAQHLPGWGFGGVGAGIALSGGVGLLASTAGTWRTAWLISAAVAVIITVVAWPLQPLPVRPAAGSGPPPPREHHGAAASRRSFAMLFLSYTLEGIGYIIAGTFLVAAINQRGPQWVGNSAWILAGLAALLGPPLWASLGRRWTAPTLLLAALIIQAIGITLPALAGGITSGLASAALFGATFLGVAAIALALGGKFRYPRAVALLTAGYSCGQVLGPLIVTPLLHDGYRVALLVGSAVVFAAAIAAFALRISMPVQTHGSDKDPQPADQLMST